MAQLGFPCPKLSKHLCDGARLNPTCRRNNKLNETRLLSLLSAIKTLEHQLSTDNQGEPLDNIQDVQTLQELVKLLGACRDLDDLCSPLVELSSCGKTHGHKFGSFSLRGKENLINASQLYTSTRQSSYSFHLCLSRLI